MKRTNKEVVEYFYERVFNAGDFSELDDLMWDDYKQHLPGSRRRQRGIYRIFQGISAGTSEDNNDPVSGRWRSGMYVLQM